MSRKSITRERRHKTSSRRGRKSSYAVGYAKPPVHSRFAPGKSGNPKGRPKGQLNLETELANELNRLITVREGDHSRRLKKGAAWIVKIVNGALNNDPKATATLVALLRPSLGQQPQGTVDAPLTINDQDLLADFLQRHGDFDNNGSGEVDAGAPQSKDQKKAG